MDIYVAIESCFSDDKTTLTYLKEYIDKLSINTIEILKTNISHDHRTLADVFMHIRKIKYKRS